MGRCCLSRGQSLDTQPSVALLQLGRKPILTGGFSRKKRDNAVDGLKQQFGGPELPSPQE